MKKINLLLLFAFAASSVLITSCSKDDDNGRARVTISPGENAEAEAQTALIELVDGTDIYFQEGTYNFSNQLSIDDKKDVRIYGAGIDKTILNFSGQTGSGEGLYATNCVGILFQDFTISDTKGDALKAKDCSQISFINVGTVWTGTPEESNGAYGLYPVLCQDVLIDGCYAYGASDAGVYVGQSNNVVVRNSKAEGNVAGIEIENTTNADVYDNEATDNTGGILVFDLPGLTQAGSKTRVFNNNVHNNNRTSFAPAGNIVGTVPAGTGVMVLATEKVEIFDNNLDGNEFSNVILVSYLFVDDKVDQTNYNPYYSDIYIHDNTYVRNGNLNSQQNDTNAFLINLLDQYGFDQPDILIDGITAGGGICIFETAGTTFVNVDALVLVPKSNLSTFTCQGDELAPVEFEPYAATL